MRKKLAGMALLGVVLVGATPYAGAFDMGKMNQTNPISAGGSHTAAVHAEGTLWLWGNNASGQIGNGTRVTTDRPVKIGLQNVISVALGSNHSAAITADGALWLWGSNAKGQIGNGTQKDALEPYKVMDQVAAVSIGGAHSAALKTDGTLWLWGDNTQGQLGNSTTQESLKPIQIMDNVVAVALGGQHSAAIKKDGSLWMWGSNLHGELGNGGTGNATSNQGIIQTVPVKIMDGVAVVSLGQAHTGVVKTHGSLWMWGNNSGSQIGNANKGNATMANGTPIQTVPVQVLSEVKTISLGSEHTAAVKNDGSLWMWGKNMEGQLGDGRYGSGADLIEPKKMYTQMVTASLGEAHSVALMDNNSLWAWGLNSSNQLGDLDVRNATDQKNQKIQTIRYKLPSFTAKLPGEVPQTLKEYVSQPSEWAQSEISEARAQGLLTTALDGNYTTPLKRVEFAQLCLRVLELYHGKTAEQLAAAAPGKAIAFTDTDDIAVRVASAYGIVSGIDTKTFAPNNTLTREQAATMLVRLASNLGSIPEQEQSNFQDLAKASGWAKNSIIQVAALEDKAAGKRVMGGVTLVMFDPKGTYTREQGICSMLRLLHWAQSV